MRWLQFSSATLLLASAVKAWEWDWAVSGEASMTHYELNGGGGSCNVSAMGNAAGPTAAISGLSYGSWSGLGGGPACGLCYALTVYGSYDGQADPALFPKCSLVVRVTDQCPYPDNKEWCPGPEQPPSEEYLNPRGMRYHFDINISSGQGEAREWFPRDASGNLLGTGKVYFEMVSCREWSGWKYGAKNITTLKDETWGCIALDPGYDGEGMCGIPDPDDPLAGNANAKTTQPENFPFLKDNGYVLPDEGESNIGNEKATAADTKKATTTTTTAAAKATNTATCWSKDMGYECCSGCDVVYSDNDGDWGLEKGEWCGIPENCTTPSAATDSCTGAPDYPCCKGCDVAYTDDSGQWGIESNQWCGISSTCKGSAATATTTTKCFSEPDYPCCKSTCNVIDTDENGKWGVENGDWCGIPDTCATSTKNKRGGFTILPKCNNPLPTCVALYDQCGGDGYYGPTECCKGKCTSQGPYYSQCAEE